MESGDRTNHDPGGMKRKQLFLLFAVCFATRAILYLFCDRAPSDAAANIDPQEYMQYARNLAEHGSFSNTPEPPLYRSAVRTPVYPLMIAAALKLTANEDAAIRLVLWLQMLMGAATAVLASLAAWQLLRDSRWALAAGYAAGLEPNSIFYGHLVWTESLFTFLFFSSVLLLVSYFQSDSPRLKFLPLAGVMLGISTLCRPVGHYIALLLVPLFLLLDGRVRPVTRFGRAVVPFLVTYGLVIVPWMARNARALDLLDISHLAPGEKVLVAAFFETQGRAPSEPSGKDVHREATIRMLESYRIEFNHTHGTDLQFYGNPVAPMITSEKWTGDWSRFLSAKADPILWSHWWLFARYATYTAFRTLFGFNKDILCNILGISPSKSRVTVAARHIVSGRLHQGFAEMAKFIWPEWVGLAWAGLYTLGVTCTAAVGLWFGVHGTNPRLVVFLAVVMAALVVLPSLFAPFGFATTRFRIPLVPFLAVFSAWGLRECAIRWRLRSSSTPPRQGDTAATV